MKAKKVIFIILGFIVYLFAIPFSFWSGWKYYDNTKYHNFYHHTKWDFSTAEICEDIGLACGIKIPSDATNIFFIPSIPIPDMLIITDYLYNFIKIQI